MSVSGEVDWAGAAEAQEKNLVEQVGCLQVANGEQLLVMKEPL